MDKQYPIGKFSYNGPLSHDDRNHAIEQISTLADRLTDLVAPFNDKLMDTPYRKGGWTARQVIHHLMDSHLNAYARFKHAITEDHPTIKTYDQDDWANLPDSHLPIEVSVHALHGIHKRLGYLLAGLEEEVFNRTFNHPEHGDITIDYLVALYAWHGDHHLEHIKLSLHDD